MWRARVLVVEVDGERCVRLGRDLGLVELHGRGDEVDDGTAAAARDGRGGRARGRELAVIPGLELRGIHGMDFEHHDPMADPAQLGALAAERLIRKLGFDREVELVDDARHDVALEQELRDVERVDHVGAR